MIGLHIRTKGDVLALRSRVIGWGCRHVRGGTRAYAAVTMALQYLEYAADLAGSRRTHFLRCARDQWRVAVRLTGGQS